MSTVAEPVTVTVDAASRFLIRNLDWAAYRQITEALAGRHVRLTYDRGNLELMTISSDHAYLSRLFAQIIVILTDELDRGRRSLGDMTCDREELDRGLQPHECFYVQHEPAVRGKRAIDFSVDPPPDLAIEVDLSRPLRNRREIYAALGVPELWSFDGNTLVGHRLVDGVYEPTEQSGSFPELRVADIQPFLERRYEVDERTLMRSFLEWVRENVVP